MPEIPLTGSEADAFTRKAQRILRPGDKRKLKRAYAKRVRRKGKKAAGSEAS